MRSIASRWRAASKSVTAFLALSALACTSFASTRPRYGGTLRIELLAQSVSVDPRTWKPGSRDFAANERLAALIFDRLVSLDNYGRFAPQLATEWSHDGSFKHWQFLLRSDAKFSDGAQLTASEAAAALAPLLPDDLKVSASGGSLIFQSTDSRPDLLELLASGRFFVYRVMPDGSLLGTGAFTQDDPTKNIKAPAPETGTAQPSVQKLRFSANESCWAGRPFLNAVEVSYGVPPLRALFDLQVGRAELVELAPDIVRRATQSNTRVWASSPLTVYALRFEDSFPADSTKKLREAISLSLDRATMAGVLLQKQAEPAATLLPQWLSGYAFLFKAEVDLERAKKLRASLPLNIAGGTSPLRLQSEASGDLARLLAERVAVNARQASLAVQHLSKATNAAELHLFAWRIESLSAGQELRELAKEARLEDSKEGNPADPDRRYAWERKILEERKLMPLVAVPDYAGIAATVRDWQPSPWGEWRLADVWLEPATSQKSPVPARSAPTGARP
ncbi:MAG TPA: ABC transporter substrate-binding protein [Candidatus Acidoferrum sp.]|nr:ABC transporter substrate-binding protein [Candidatus Acidoferrum sp.]